MDYVTELNSGTVVHRAGLNKLSSEDLAVALNKIYQRGKHVTIVDHVGQFFGDDNLYRALENNSPELTVILEYRKLDLTPAQMNTVFDFVALKDYVEKALAALAPPPPAYPFAAVPDGWTVAGHINCRAKDFARTNGNGDYTIGRITLQRVWNAAAAVWAGNSTDRRIADVRASGYNRSATITADGVSIGCQDIARYELEQLAVHEGWAIPEPIK